MVKRREIKNSTVEFLIFQIESKADGVEVMYAEKTVWRTQDAIALLFDKGRSTITEHLNNIFSEGELQKDSVCRKFRRTASDGKEYQKLTDIFELAERMAKQHIPMTMEDWAERGL